MFGIINCPGAPTVPFPEPPDPPITFTVVEPEKTDPPVSVLFTDPQVSTVPFSFADFDADPLFDFNSLTDPSGTFYTGLQVMKREAFTKTTLSWSESVLDALIKPVLAKVI